MALIEQDGQEAALDIVIEELGQDLDTALDFISSEFERERARAQRYYNGDSDLPVDANRSKYVATKVRDIIRSVRPSLMRVFMSCDSPAVFVPNNIKQAQICDAQTLWVSQLFYDLGGYETIYSAFHSAMLFKLGVIKYYYEEEGEQTFRSYTGLGEQHMQMLDSHPMIEIISAEENVHPGPQGMMRTYSVEVVGTRMNGSVNMSWVPLTEFLINRNATCKKDARVVGHRRNVIRGEAVAMGIDPELLEDLNEDNVEVSRYAEESDARRGYTVFPSESDTQDWSMQEILLTEAYYRADLDGTGIPQLYKFLLGGTSYKLLDYERVDEIPFAFFSIDPEPGTLFGKSLYDIVEKEQDALTSVTRASIDNFHMSNNPRLAVHEHMVNMADVLNNDLGSPIRVRAAGQIQVIDVPFTGQAALPLLNHLDQDVESKTGVTRAAAGLDPNAMQSTDKDAVQNTIKLAQGQVELMARNLAESGMKDLFCGLLKLAQTHLDVNQLLRNPQGAQPIQIDVFDPKMKMRVVVGTGNGDPEGKEQMLNEIYSVQKDIIMQYGPGNPMASMQHMQNTIMDKMKLKGMYNPLRYFGEVTPELEQQMAKQFQESSKQKEAAQKEIATMQAGALQQAEKIKAEAKIMTDREKNILEMGKARQEGQIKAAQIKQREDAEFRQVMVQDDRERDKMIQELYIEIAKLREDFTKANAQTSRLQGEN